MKEIIRAFFRKDWTMEEKVLVTTAVFLAGMVVGFICSPVTSISCGNHCGNTYAHKKGEETV